MQDRPFPESQLHGEIEEVFPDVFFVTGSLKMGPGLRISRNMTVVRDGESLTVVNSVRLDDAGLKALDALGKVEHVIRLAGFHGMDDPFYKDRYGAKVWAVRGMKYRTGLTPKKGQDVYFEADEALDAESDLPIEGARLYTFDVKPPEGILVLERGGGIAIGGDALQNWGGTNRYFSFLGKVMMRVLGFIAPHKLGRGWLKATNPTAATIRGVLDLEFDHFLPAHGERVEGGARDKFRPAIEAYAAK